MTGIIPPWEFNEIWVVGSLEKIVEIPDSYSLGNPYPNPFNPVTNIDYSLPVAGIVELVIYDLRGRIVEELISGYVEAGHYEIKWDAKDIASGMYVVKMKSANTILTRKIVLMK